MSTVQIFDIHLSHRGAVVEVGTFHLSEGRQVHVSSTETPRLSIIPPRYTNQCEPVTSDCLADVISLLVMQWGGDVSAT
jgi:hypothetical protein